MYNFTETVMETTESNFKTTEMFQKFAQAFKTKTYELFSENQQDQENYDDVTLLLDSPEDFIPDQKVVVIKPDPFSGPRKSPKKIEPLLASLFATVSSFETFYLQFQSAHVPRIDEKGLELADKSLISIFKKLDLMKELYKRNDFDDFEFPASSFSEFCVQENQSKLRGLETVVNVLQLQIDLKSDEVKGLRKELGEIRVCNAGLSRKMGKGMEVLLSVRVFEAMLSDSVKACRVFTKILIDLMRKAGWDLEGVYSGVEYAKEGHFRYWILSYVCLGIFQGFDKSGFGLSDNDDESVEIDRNGYLRQLIDHVAVNPMESLGKSPKCEFARFCEMRYEELIHPKMETSIFMDLDRKEKVLDSWKSLSVFYESFVKMASSVWVLHKLAYSFSPTVEIFQVERGVEFSMVFMEDVLGKFKKSENRPKVGFTVVPGFKVGRTVIQSQVYLTTVKSSE